MGIIRTLLATSVVFGHTWPCGALLVGGQKAVQLFYIISGFLISYVLTERCKYTKISNFYINRYLRLYPIYIFVALLTLLVFIATEDDSFINVYKYTPLFANLFLIFSNIFIFTQDWILFSGIENNTLVFSANYISSKIQMHEGLLVPQAWTLGLELSFYLVAPLILPKRNLIYLFLSISILISIYLNCIGLGNKDPWSYRFFPAELLFFLLGALSHQLLLPFYKKFFIQDKKLISNISTIFLIILITFYPYISFFGLNKNIFLFSTFIIFLPFSFVFQNQYNFDRLIGEISYPIYIIHVLVMYIVNYFACKIEIDNKYFISLLCVFVSIIFSLLLNKFLAEPFEKIRNKIRH
ncbi:MAG: acyltransferase [Candidatus Paracaedibacteraceae bacterium]|nr:acyltransferase [Candidatus Paracaedibacteraceae bacterium]